MKLRIWTQMAGLCLSLFLIGCTAARPHRTDLVAHGTAQCPFDKAANLPGCAHVTPETGSGGYELHFVEYDDQGWAYSIPERSAKPNGIQTVSQTDHLMRRLGTLLGDEGRYLSVILYVHGWKHDARAGDRDVIRFRQILESASKLEKYRGAPPRKVVGIYVGWRGKSWDFPHAALNLTFWTRKAAALRIAQGAVQELFARLRTVQRIYNSRTKSPDCAQARAGVMSTGGCRLRTLMIGHSFGAWILYSATSGPLIATLNADKDAARVRSGVEAPAAEKSAEQLNEERRARLADLIVLINPAFEASRYEPVHQAAINYQTPVLQPPLLVTITSSADMATKMAFPAGRFFNSLFEHPLSSQEQNEAIVHTHGHIDRYQTHKLVGVDSTTCPGWQHPGPLSSDDRAALQNNLRIETGNSARFFNRFTQDTGLLGPEWVRNFCGGVKLSLLPATGPGQNRDPNSLVWNIRTDESLIQSHSEIMDTKFLEFVRQLYDDSDLRSPLAAGAVSSNTAGPGSRAVPKP